MIFFRNKPIRKGLVVREATVEDANGIIDVSNSVGREKQYIVNEIFSWSEEEEKSLIKRLDRNKDIILVAEYDGNIAGFVTLFRYFGGKSPKVQHVAELGICIKSEYRGMGIGHKLMDASISWAENHNYTKLCLSVFSTNERAIHLYKNYGFVEEGRRINQFLLYDGYADEILMGKFLQQQPHKI